VTNPIDRPARRPDVFIVGAPKSGTSSLHRYLEQHPEVFMSRPKEPGYFAPDVTGARTENPFRYPEDEAIYLAIFAGAGTAPRVGEASTTYLMSRDAPQLVHDFQPDARIIVMVRNPVDLLHSLHGQRVGDGSEPIDDFAAALAADEERRAGRRLPEGHLGYGVAYRDNALLGEQLDRWLASFARQQVHVIIYDDFARDTAGSFRSVLRFLDVDPSFEPASFDAYKASYRKRRNPLRPLYRNRLSRWLSQRALPAMLGKSRAESVRGAVGVRRVAQQRVERAPISAALRRQLEQEFAGDVDLLGRLVGRDLAGEWFREAQPAVKP
jgi:sulfotransferase family protein